MTPARTEAIAALRAAQCDLGLASDNLQAACQRFTLARNLCNLAARNLAAAERREPAVWPITGALR